MHKLNIFKAGFLAICFYSLNSCSTNDVDESEVSAYGSKDYAESLVSSIPARWFETVDRFSLKDSKGAPIPHLFFDTFARVNPKEKTLNFIALTPEGHPTEQGLDLASGQLYLKRKYCVQSDAWNRYEGEINLPPFTMGVVPRVLDQLNTPQKIIVFGQGGYYRKYFKRNFFDARVVGAYVEQTCPHGACVTKGSWLSRLVLIGVQKENKTYQSVKNVEDLKKLVDWPKIRAFIENGQGHNLIVEKFYPAVRMGAVVDASQAFRFLKDYSHFFTNLKLKQMRIGCYKMYDYLWKDFSIGLAQRNGKAKEKKELKDKNIIFVEGEEKNKTSGFHKRFYKNFKRYHERYKTCSKYILPSSVNANPDRHWFFSFLTGYHKLHELGYFYDCKRGGWASNPYISKKEQVVPLDEQFRSCGEASFNRAMKTLPHFLNTLKERSKDSYRYVDYDNRAFGTHSKIYSWLEHDNKILSCSKDEKGEFFKHKLPTFPKDIRWDQVGNK